MNKSHRALALLFSLFTLTTFSQNYQINLSDEFKLKKGSANLDIIYADDTGLYFTESRIKFNFTPLSSNNTNSQKLMKFDRNYQPIYEKEYKAELKGFNFNSFQAIDNDIYMFATDFISKDKTFRTYGSKVTKDDGGVATKLTEISSFPLEHKRDVYEMKVTSVRKGKNVLMVANISGKDHLTLGVSLLDKNLKQLESATINLSYPERDYILQDVIFTTSNKIVLLGKQFEETQVGKKKKKRLVFKQYLLSIYSSKGQKEKEIVLESGDKFVIGGQLIEQESGEILLAGFYSNKAKKDDLNGFFINKVDPLTGTMALTSYKEINAGMLGNSFEDVAADDDDDDKDAKESKKKGSNDDDDEEEFANEFTIKSIDINPADQSIIITSEMSAYRYFHMTSRDLSNNSGFVTYTDKVTHTFTNKDIMVINADKEGKIKWMNVLPKSQKEVVVDTRQGSSMGGFSDRSMGGYYFVRAGGMPFYSSYISLLNKNNLVLLMNDNRSNNVQVQYGDKVRSISNFKKRSSVYGVSIDLATGKINRKFIFANDGETILMPRHGYVINNEVIIPSMRMKSMAKSELKFAKITVK